GLPVDRRVRSVIDGQRSVLESLGCIVEDATPDLSGAEDAFLTIRRWRSWSAYGPLLARHRDRIKPEALAEIEAGARLSGADVARAMVAHGALLEHVRRFEERYEFLVCTVSQVPPFDVGLDWP